MRLNQLKQARHILIKQAKHKKLNHKGDNRINSLEIEITRIRNDLDNLKDDLIDIRDYNNHKSNIGQTLLDNLFYIVLGLIISYIAHGLIHGF